jgi:ubiquinone/menaquinone biosynthesis C-methylase UbiE
MFAYWKKNNIVSLLFQSPYVYLANQKFWVGNYNSLIKELFDIKPDENILDVACGVSMVAPYIKGYYTGVDINKNYIQYNNKKYPANNYICQDFKEIKFGAKSFDQSIVINFLHHLPDDEIKQLLDRMGQLTKNKIIIADLSPNDKNFLARFLYSMDQGKFIRQENVLTKLISQSLKIEKVYTFLSPRRIYKHIVFVCSPRN